MRDQFAAWYTPSPERREQFILNGLIALDTNILPDLYRMNNEALVQIHDYYRAQVGGIPALSFLLATRILDPASFDPCTEDASVILLRVLDHANLPNAEEAMRVRVESAQRVTRDGTRTWDDSGVMDPMTHQLLSYTGVRCRVLGTFYVGQTGNDMYALSFGSDLSNYYPKRSLILQQRFVACGPWRPQPGPLRARAARGHPFLRARGPWPRPVHAFSRED